MNFNNSEIVDFKETWDRTPKMAKFACINLILVILLSAHCYLRWFMPGGLYQIAFLCMTFSSLWWLNISLEFDRYTQFLAVLIVLFIVFFTLPIMGHSLSLGYCLADLILLLTIFYPKYIFSTAYKLLRQIIYIVCLCSIFVWILHMMGGDLPHYSVGNIEWRESLTDSYKIYGPCVSMYFNGGFINGIERCNGIFGEPGHFGIFLGFIMAGNRFRFTSSQDYVFLITGILTFSTAFFGIMAIGLIYRLLEIRESKNDIMLIMLIGCLAIPAALSNSNIYENVIGRVLKDKESISINEMVEQRVLDSTRFKYENMIKSDKKWFGVGDSQTLIQNTSSIMQYTNWRGGIYRHGIIGMGILCLLIYFITTKCDWRYSLMILAIMVLVMSHRMYQVTTWGILFLEFLAVQVNSISVDECEAEYTDLTN